jgi:hypothetical protein
MSDYLYKPLSYAGLAPVIGKIGTVPAKLITPILPIVEHLYFKAAARRFVFILRHFIYQRRKGICKPAF